MLEKISGIEQRYDEIYQELMIVGDDYERAADLGKERSDLDPIISKAKEYRQALENLEEAKEIRDSGDDDMD